ncbi:hypothetical protein F3Y22_tig00110013pilonHSYRG00303 [Hibiscus syriacus]|uniref:Uncharacterized protein n=1 Tax=Hibiscus syriacus TaxID=106335 RepID=A0A6A3BPC1_HIBSY|nr:hypothetical protein F3Y22_tig00110013pilonHSYRG00303 [Hibiscus syriacus]
MADTVISVAVQLALSKAISILEDPINLAWDFKDDLNKFRSSLSLTRAFLQDAERRQLDESVKVWLEQLRDIASKDDDILDELAYEHIRRKDAEKDLYGSITSCKMHDSVHDLARPVSRTRQQQNVFDNVKLLHSLFLNSSSFIHMVRDFKGIRVLKFCGAYIDSLPDSIGKLKHLRYFDISRTQIKRLPKSIAHLYLLETLRLLWCFELEHLPGGMESLVNLRHLYISYGHHVPVENVRDKEEARGARLWEKKKLQKLQYQWNSRWNFFWEGRRKDEEVLEGLKPHEEVLEGLEPHSNLKSLTMEDFKGGYYPSWLVGKTGSDPSASFQPVNQVELKLLCCENVKNLPPFGQYPILKFLEIDGLHCEGHRKRILYEWL